MLQSIKKSLFILVILGFPGGSHFAYGNVEISGHFGKKFQDYGAWNFGADALYRSFLDDRSSFALGARYRYFFKSIEESASANNIGGGTTAVQSSGKRNAHRLALLTNYRFHIDHFFIGAIVGIDIWKSVNSTGKASGSRSGSSASAEVNVTSSQFLWNKFTGQLALELGYTITSNFLVKLEAGYDVFGFNKYKMEVSTTGSSNTNADIEGDIKYNGFYATLGFGYFFG